MSEILIMCENLIDEYKLDKDQIIEDLKNEGVAEEYPYPYKYSKDHMYSLVAKKENDKIVLTNIIKAESFREQDTSEIFNLK